MTPFSFVVEDEHVIDYQLLDNNRLMCCFFKMISGALVTEVQSKYSEWAQLTARLYNDDRMEVEWTVGPLPYLGLANTDVIVKYKTSDSNVISGESIRTSFLLSVEGT